MSALTLEHWLQLRGCRVASGQCCGTGSETDPPLGTVEPLVETDISNTHSLLSTSGRPRQQVSGLIAPGPKRRLVQLPFESLGCLECFINVPFCLVSADEALSSNTPPPEQLHLARPAPVL